MQLNHYPNIFSPAITATISPIDWINQIKGSQHVDTINTARQIKLLYNSTGNPVFKTEYNKLKTSLPALTWNATFTDSKSDINFKACSGFMFIDVDDLSFDIKSLDTDKIYTYYKSIGGLGYSLIVKVDGITPDNFHSTFYSITDDLGISKFIDKQAVKLTQSSILSYDTDLFYNPVSFIYSALNVELSIVNQFCTDGHIISLKKEKHNVTVSTKSNIVFNNLDEFDFNGEDYIEDWINGLAYVFCSKPFKPLTDGRKRYMMNYIRNYVWLNPDASLYQIINSAKLVNLSVSIDSLPTNIIEKQVQAVVKQKNEGKLTPKVKRRSIIFNPRTLLTKDEKAKIRAERQSQYYTDLTLPEMYVVIEDWNFQSNGKITIRSVATATGFAASTVSNYWHHLKEYVKGENAENLLEVKLFKQEKLRVIKDTTDDDLDQLMEDMNVQTLTEQARINKSI